MKVLLSIKPVYVSQIFSGNKKFEFRRSIFKNPDIKIAVVYASSPMRQIVGEFSIRYVIHDSIQELWKTTKDEAGISKKEFFEYFNNKDTGYAIKIGEIREYRQPLRLQETFGVAPPQSFTYLL